MRTTSHNKTGYHPNTALQVIRKYKSLLPKWKNADIIYTTRIGNSPVQVLIDINPGGYNVNRTRFTSVDVRVMLQEGSWSEALELAEALAYYSDFLGGYAATDSDNRITRAEVSSAPDAFDVPSDSGEPPYQAAFTLDLQTRALDNLPNFS